MSTIDTLKDDKLDRIRELINQSTDEFTEYPDTHDYKVHYSPITRFFENSDPSRSFFGCNMCNGVGESAMGINHEESCGIGKLLEIINE